MTVVTVTDTAWSAAAMTYRGGERGRALDVGLADRGAVGSNPGGVVVCRVNRRPDNSTIGG